MTPSDLDTRTAFDRLVLVFVSVRIPEGLLAKGLLESEGIHVFVKGESEGPYRMGPVYLWVPQAEEVQARLVLDSIGETGPEAS